MYVICGMIYADVGAPSPNVGFPKFKFLMGVPVTKIYANLISLLHSGVGLGENSHKIERSLQMAFSKAFV